MGHINLRIPDDLDYEFRQLAARKFGARKGFLTSAVVEAFTEWVTKNTSR